MPDPKILLWADVESTGVLEDPITPTVLELSWTLTDTDGVLITPVRQRFTCLPAAHSEQAHDEWVAVAPAYHPCGENGVPVEGSKVRWCSEHLEDPAEYDRITTARYGEVYPDPFVRAMHDQNGLAELWAGALPAANAQTDELLAAATTDAERDKLREHGLIPIDWTHIDRLMHADLQAAGVADLQHGQVLLAGGGVSHYENRFMRRACPRTFDRAFMHYSAGVDNSTLIRALATRLQSAEPAGVPQLRRADDIIAFAREHLYPAHFEHALGEFTLARPTAGPDTLWADPQRPTHPLVHYLTAEKDNHRAVAGVIRAIAAYRLLPHVAASILPMWDEKYWEAQP